MIMYTELLEHTRDYQELAATAYKSYQRERLLNLYTDTSPFYISSQEHYARLYLEAHRSLVELVAAGPAPR